MQAWMFVACPLLADALRLGKPPLEMAEVPRVLDLLAGGERGEVAQAGSMPTPRARRMSLNVGRLDADVQEPVAARIAQKLVPSLILAPAGARGS